MTNTNQVEDQVFEDEEQKGFLSVRNMAIIGGVTLLVLTGLGVFYRNELFGSKSADAETEKPITDPVVPVPIATPGSEEAPVITFEQYKLNAQLLPEIKAFRIYYTSSHKAFIADSNQPKFTLVMQCPYDQYGSGDSLVKKEFNSFETLFKAYANASEGCVMVRGINEYMFKRSDDDKFLLPIKHQKDSKTDVVVAEPFAELLKKIKDIVKGGSDSAPQIDYAELKKAFIEELPKVESRLSLEEIKFEIAHPLRLRFCIPVNVELAEEFKKLNPIILNENLDGYKLYTIFFKDSRMMEEMRKKKTY